MERDFGKRSVAMLIVTIWITVSLIALAIFMTNAQLAEMQNTVTLAMQDTDEWQEVRIPAGVYKIGESIPAGTWTIKPVKGDFVVVGYSDRINEAGTDIERPALFDEFLCSPANSDYRDRNKTELTINLTEGKYIQFSADVIFTTPIPTTFNFKN